MVCAAIYWQSLILVQGYDDNIWVCVPFQRVDLTDLVWRTQHFGTTVYLVTLVTVLLKAALISECVRIPMLDSSRKAGLINLGLAVYGHAGPSSPFPDH